MAWAALPLLGPCPVLAERDAELEALWNAAQAAASGAARLVLITGEPGAGKSRLWQEFVASLPEGWRRFDGSGADQLASAPFQRLVPALPATGDPASALAQGLADALAGDSPCVAVFDDLHAVDPLGLASLGPALALLHDDPILLIGTYRLGTHSPGSPHERAVADLLRDPSASELRLGPLSPDGVAQMAHAMNVEPVDAIYQQTAGNPFFVEELLRAPGPELPWTVGEAVAARVEALGEAAQGVARALAAAGTALPVALLDRLTPDARDGIKVLIDAVLAAEVDDGMVGLRHALVAEALEQRAPSGERRAVHRRLAAELENDGANSERIAYHWRKAGDLPRAAHHAAIAADVAHGRRAYRSAAELYRLATTHPPADLGARSRLYVRAATTAALAGLIGDALAWAEEAEACGVERGAEWRAISRYVNPALEHEREPAVLLKEASAALKAGSPSRAAELAHAAADRLGPDGEPDLLRLAGMTLVYAGALDDGMATLNAVRQRAETAGNMRDAAMAYTDLARIAGARGDFEQALALDQAGLALAQQDPEAFWSPQIQAGIAFIDVLRGDFDAARKLTRELEAIGMPFFTEFVRFVACIIDLERGFLAGPRQHIEAVVALRSVLEAPNLQVIILTARARLHLLADDPSAAHDDLAEAATVIGGVIDETLPDRLLLVARVAEALGNDDELATARLAANNMARAGAGPGVVATAAAIGAIAARVAEQHDDAARGFEAAARQWEHAPRQPLAAEAWCEAAESALAARDRETASRAVCSASAIAVRLKLDRLLVRLDRVREALETLAPASPPATHNLSPREVEIVRLVAAGRTNRQIAGALHISEITARNHLSHVFTKLGVSRRAEVARLAARLGIGIS